MPAAASSPQELNKDLEPAWETKLTGKLTALVVADSKVFVAQTDQHTLHALDAAKGNSLWTYTAGGRIDSPAHVLQGPRAVRLRRRLGLLPARLPMARWSGATGPPRSIAG